MRTKAGVFAAVVWGLFLACGVSEADLPMYQVTVIPRLGPTGMIPSGINNYGQVTGMAWPATGPQTAFLWTPYQANGVTGQFTALGGIMARGRGINDQGQIVGGADTSGHAFLWTPSGPNGTTGTAIDLPAWSSDASGGDAFAINSSGQITGSGGGSIGPSAKLWSPSSPNGQTGTLTDIGALMNSGSTYGYDINDRGQIVGNYQGTGVYPYLWNPTSPNASTGTKVNLPMLAGATYGSTHAINSSGAVVGENFMGTVNYNNAYLWTPSQANGSSGAIVDLGRLGTSGQNSWATDINDNGFVVGYSNELGFLWTAQTGMVDINTLLTSPTGSGPIANAYGINNRGQILATTLFSEVVLLTPVPEPACLALLALAGAALLARRRNSR